MGAEDPDTPDLAAENSGGGEPPQNDRGDNLGPSSDDDGLSEGSAPASADDAVPEIGVPLDPFVGEGPVVIGEVESIGTDDVRDDESGQTQQCQSGQNHPDQGQKCCRVSPVLLVRVCRGHEIEVDSAGTGPGWFRSENGRLPVIRQKTVV